MASNSREFFFPTYLFQISQKTLYLTRIIIQCSRNFLECIKPCPENNFDFFCAICPDLSVGGGANVSVVAMRYALCTNAREHAPPHTWANCFWSIYMGFYMAQLYGLEAILKKYSTFFMDQLYGFGLKFLGIIWTKICWDTRFLITLFFLQARAARKFLLGTNYNDFCLSKFFW